MGRTRGAGAHLAGSRGREAAVDLACVGTPFVGTSPAHGCWICHIRNLFHDPVWEAKGEAVRQNREREQGAYLGHASAASSPRLRCALAGRHHLSKREERAKNWEIGRVHPSERIRTGKFFYMRRVRGRREPGSVPFFSSPQSNTWVIPRLGARGSDFSAAPRNGHNMGGW